MNKERRLYAELKYARDLLWGAVGVRVESEVDREAAAELYRDAWSAWLKRDQLSCDAEAR